MPLPMNVTSIETTLRCQRGAGKCVQISPGTNLFARSGNYVVISKRQLYLHVIPGFSASVFLGRKPGGLNLVLPFTGLAHRAHAAEGWGSVLLQEQCTSEHFALLHSGQKAQQQA